MKYILAAWEILICIYHRQYYTVYTLLQYNVYTV